MVTPFVLMCVGLWFWRLTRALDKPSSKTYREVRETPMSLPVKPLCGRFDFIAPAP